MAEKLYQFKFIPKKCSYNSPSYKIYTVKFIDGDEEIIPNLYMGKYKVYSVAGDIPDLAIGQEYNSTVKRKHSQKYGFSYEPVTLEFSNATTPEEISKAFLNSIISPEKAETLMDNYPNIVDKIMNDDTKDIDFTKLKGIGEKSFKKIASKVKERYDMINIMAYFKGAISMSVVNKLQSEYNTLHSIKRNLEDDPYKALCKLPGIGFKKADEIVRKLEKEEILTNLYPVISSKERLYACLEYALLQNESNGHTLMSVLDLRALCMKETPEAIEHFTECLNNPRKSLYINKDLKLIGLSRTHNKELYILDTIRELNKKPILWKGDKEKYRNICGYPLSDEQLEPIDMMCNNNIGILTGYAGCVDCDTEYFNGKEWKRIADYTEGEMVLQYNKDGSAKLIKPSKYVKVPAETLYHFETKYGLDQTLSLGHRVVYQTSKGNLAIKPFSDVIEMHYRCKSGFTGKFYTTFNYSGEGIELSDEEIRLQIAVIADGYFGSNTNWCVMRLKKKRKIERIEKLLKDANIPYEKKFQEYTGFYIFRFYAPRREKEYEEYWYNCNKEQFKVVCNEVLNWDGSTTNSRNSFSSTSKKTIDFIQFAFATQGKRAKILIDDREGQIITGHEEQGHTHKNKCYYMNITNRNMVGIGGFHSAEDKTKIVPYKTLDGYQYCFSVPSTMLVLRRNGKIFITGNTGKTSCLKSLIQMCDDIGKKYILCSPTGKAAKVLANATNRNASTIHIALGYKVDDKGIGYFEYNKNNKLETDLVVVDEVSMLGVHLANALFEAIDTKNTKLLLIGDEGQLRSIEPMDLLHDILDKNLAPSCRLTKVYRYNDGGLSKICTDVRNGQPYMEDCPKKICTVEGVNKDFVQYAVEDSKIPNRVEYIFENLLKSGVQVDDIVILTSQNKGDYGTVAINNRIQSLYQKDYKGASYKIGNIAYLKGDKVIHCRNNYNMELSPLDERYDEEEDVTVAIMNGTTGIVVDVDNEYVDVEYPDGIVRYTKDTIQDLNLGYCITIHKSQGSTFKEVIVLLPKAHVYQFSRQLIYTAYSRTSKRCFSVGNVRYINMGIKKKSALNRNTWYKYI